MSKVIVYGNTSCAYCGAARMLLTRKGVKFEDILVDDAEKRDEMVKLSGRTSVPQIFIDSRHIGGFDELNELEKNGDLDRLLAVG